MTQGGQSHSREFGFYPKGHVGPPRDFKYRGEAGARQCGSVKDYTVVC